MNWFETTTNINNSVRPEPPGARDRIDATTLGTLKSEIERLQQLIAELLRQLRESRAITKQLALTVSDQTLRIAELEREVVQTNQRTQ